MDKYQHYTTVKPVPQSPAKLQFTPVKQDVSSIKQEHHSPVVMRGGHQQYANSTPIKNFTSMKSHTPLRIENADLHALTDLPISSDALADIVLQVLSFVVCFKGSHKKRCLVILYVSWPIVKQN